MLSDISPSILSLHPVAASIRDAISPLYWFKSTKLGAMTTAAKIPAIRTTRPISSFFTKSGLLTLSTTTHLVSRRPRDTRPGVCSIYGMRAAARPIRRAGSDAQDLARIHQVVRIDRALDLTHHAHGLAMLGDQEIHLADADAVLARAGAVHGECAHDHALIEVLGLVPFRLIVRIDQEQEMEIAVADVADERDRHGGFGDVLVSLENALRKARDRHADIGR